MGKTVHLPYADSTHANHLVIQLVANRCDGEETVKSFCFPDRRYNLLLKIEYAGRTLYDCQGTSPPNPASNAMCTVVPPGGLAGKLHLQVVLHQPCPTRLKDVFAQCFWGTPSFWGSVKMKGFVPGCYVTASC